MSGAQHLIRRGPDDWQLRTICGSDDDPVDTITAETFQEQLGVATGQPTAMDDDMPLICALCATKFIDEERKP